ncbi:MAG: UDP-N-acetylglucosamine 2-epimerase [Oscillospiraceae bacterium]|nr:UDP-N-acetylglucosamine 2-epimerase [Oscillospiraceae bacterium]
MKKIAIVTATRAEYGLFYPVIRELRKYEDESLKVDLIVTGTHLSDKYGNTINEIKKDNIRIDHTIKISVDSDSVTDISGNQAEALVKFTALFKNEGYGCVLLLGDRYETLAIAIAAGNTRTPIFHLCGGDTTEGAIDEWIRHSISKMAYIHFVTNEISRKRVIQLGESPDRVYNYGSTSLDNILGLDLLSKTEALNSIDMEECEYILCTYHPVTMEDVNVEKQMCEFIETIKLFPDIQFIVTKSNADLGGAKINEILDEQEKKVTNLHVFTSLGIMRYLSLMKYALAVLGNSSSGIIESPAFKIPTVNIGDRQKGRLQSESIINCLPDSESIAHAVRKAIEPDFQKFCKSVVSPYGNGTAANRIAKKTVGIIMNNEIDLKKKFFDLE